MHPNHSAVPARQSNNAVAINNGEASYYVDAIQCCGCYPSVSVRCGHGVVNNLVAPSIVAWTYIDPGTAFVISRALLVATAV